MATAGLLPEFGCEHLTNDHVNKIDEQRKSNSLHSDFVQYRCLQCPISGGFPFLDKHFEKTKHEFAVSQKSIYCGQCADLVYEPSFAPSGRKRKLVQVDGEDDSYLTANTSQRPCGREGVRGLFNLGETCYMNAVLQMMVHNPLLASYFLGMGHPLHLCPISKEPDKKNDSDSEDDELGEDKVDQKSCVACGMTEVFSDTHMVDQSIPAHAVNLLFASWKNIPHMSGKSQQDAQEWFIMIVDKLHEAVADKNSDKARCDCFFHKVFFGRLASEIVCDSCRTTSTNEEEYSSISLDFQKQKKKKKKDLPIVKALVKAPIPNVHECLKSYTAPEVLSTDDYSCRKCDQPRTAKKRLRVRKLPAILCIHVKRFGLNPTSMLPEKYGGRIEFPLELDMGLYTTTSNPEDKIEYDLDAVVVHQGDQLQNGHYFAFCRQGSQWFRFDDEIVSATTTEDVMRQEAYLLFYSMRHLSTA